MSGLRETGLCLARENEYFEALAGRQLPRFFGIAMLKRDLIFNIYIYQCSFKVC